MMKLKRIYIALPVIALCFLGCGIKPGSSSPQPTARSKWIGLRKGDYIREEYIDSICKNRSPLRTWEYLNAAKMTGMEEITVEGNGENVSVSAGYNFHEAVDPVTPEDSGVLHIDSEAYSMNPGGPESFRLSDGRSTTEFRYVGDWQHWANRAVIAGTYEDQSGSKYVFDNDGTAHFPANRSFDYEVGLDMVLTNYDYIYSDQLHSTWAVKLTSRGISLYDVDVNRNEPYGLAAKTPRWRLKQLTPVSCR